jgi:hypothetical protein
MSALDSISAYENFIYGLPNQHPQILYSTLVLKRLGPHVGEISGSVFFGDEVRLNIRELIDFRRKRIKTYSYEVYRSRDKQYWYDDQPHPNDPSLQSTHPHHKHIHPDIKHHRIPAPHIHFDQSNLPFLLQEIIDNFLKE